MATSVNVPVMSSVSWVWLSLYMHSFVFECIIIIPFQQCCSADMKSLHITHLFCKILKSENYLKESKEHFSSTFLMKSKKVNVAILAGFPCSHRKFILHYKPNVSSLQIFDIVIVTIFGVRWFAGHQRFYPWIAF